MILSSGISFTVWLYDKPLPRRVVWAISGDRRRKFFSRRETGDANGHVFKRRPFMNA
jgi:hypothetical protein